MRPQYKNKDLLKIQPFYSEEIKSNKKKKRKTKIFTKNPKELTIKQLSDVLVFPPKKPKKPKRLTKCQILSNILYFLIVQVFQENNTLLEIMQEPIMSKLSIVKT